MSQSISSLSNPLARRPGRETRFFTMRDSGPREAVLVDGRLYHRVVIEKWADRDWHVRCLRHSCTYEQHYAPGQQAALRWAKSHVLANVDERWLGETRSPARTDA